MLEKVAKRKRMTDTIVSRVPSDLKDYVNQASTELGVSASAYVIQLIENDRELNTIVATLDTDVFNYVTELKIQLGDETYSDAINRLIKEGMIAHEN